MGPGNLDDDNWKPRIAVVENTLSSWRQRILSFQGRALVINALAFSRVWYVASLIHMPPLGRWGTAEAGLQLFLKGQEGYCCSSCGCPGTLSWSVLGSKLKVQSLLVQWVRRFVTAQSSWSAFVHFWFHTVFNSSAVDVFSRPFPFSPRALPPFYQLLLLA